MVNMMGIRPEIKLIFGINNLEHKWNKDGTNYVISDPRCEIQDIPPYEVTPYEIDYNDYHNMEHGKAKDEAFARIMFDNAYCGRRPNLQPQRYTDILYHNPITGVLGIRIGESLRSDDLTYAVCALFPELSNPESTVNYVEVPQSSIYEYNVVRALTGPGLEDMKYSEWYAFARKVMKAEKPRYREFLKARRNKWLYRNFEMYDLISWCKILFRLIDRLGITVSPRDVRLMIVADWN